MESFPNIRDGRKTVAIVGTAERLVAVNTPCRKVEIQALPTNSDNVSIGNSTTLASSGSERGIVLVPNQVATLYVQDLYALYVDAAVAAEGVTFTYFF